MARLSLKGIHRQIVIIDGVSVRIHNDSLIVAGLPNALLTSNDIVQVLDKNNIKCDTDRAGEVVIPKPAHAKNLHHWASIT